MDNYDALDDNIIQDIIEHQKDLSQLLTIINQLTLDKYDLGFNDGYEAGEHSGWCDCYDMLTDDD